MEGERVNKGRREINNEIGNCGQTGGEKKGVECVCVVVLPGSYRTWVLQSPAPAWRTRL